MLKDFSKNKYDILIQAGQSNAEGYGFGPTDNPWQPNEKVWYLNENYTISQAAEKVFRNDIQSNFALSFAREYMQSGYLESERKILILRAAVGGTGFLNNRWRPGDDLYLRMTDMIRTALELNPANRLIALLWHQGETDVSFRATYETHYKNLMTFVTNLRKEFNCEEMPFIAGDFVQQWKTIHILDCLPVVSAIQAVCHDCGNGGFAETDGLLSNVQELHRSPTGGEDTGHFSRNSVYELGKRYFKVFQSIVEPI